MKNRHHYPEEWFDTIRPAVLLRDNYKCTEIGCKVKHRSIGYYSHIGAWVECDAHMQKWAKTNGFKIQKIHLQVAHLDQNKNNCTMQNLKTMCPVHHLAYDRYWNNLKRKMAGRQQ